METGIKNKKIIEEFWLKFRPNYIPQNNVSASPICDSTGYQKTAATFTQNVYQNDCLIPNFAFGMVNCYYLLGW